MSVLCEAVVSGCAAVLLRLLFFLKESGIKDSCQKPKSQDEWTSSTLSDARGESPSLEQSSSPEKLSKDC